MDERMRILKLLEEGKITVEEAVKLLEAIKGERGEKESPKNAFKMVGSVVSDTLGMIPHIIESAFRTAGMGFKAGIVETEYNADEIDKLIVKFAGGDVNLRGVESNKIRIKGGGIGKTLKEERTLITKFAGGDVEIDVPTNLKLVLSLAGGDIEGRDLPGDIKIRSAGGDAELSLKEVKKVDIELKGGDLEIEVPKESSFTFEIEVEHGDLTLPEGLVFEEKGRNYARGRYGEEPEGHLHLYSKYGDVELKFKK
jgi:DUF4097 and DUF4098 domain-containing protein YvlB